jgi:hypothetical protein
MNGVLQRPPLGVLWHPDNRNGCDSPCQLGSLTAAFSLWRSLGVATGFRLQVAAHQTESGQRGHCFLHPQTLSTPRSPAPASAPPHPQTLRVAQRQRRLLLLLRQPRRRARRRRGQRVRLPAAAHRRRHRRSCQRCACRALCAVSSSWSRVATDHPHDDHPFAPSSRSRPSSRSSLSIIRARTRGK